MRIAQQPAVSLGIVSGRRLDDLRAPHAASRSRLSRRPARPRDRDRRPPHDASRFVVRGRAARRDGRVPAQIARRVSRRVHRGQGRECGRACAAAAQRHARTRVRARRCARGAVDCRRTTSAVSMATRWSSTCRTSTVTRATRRSGFSRTSKRNCSAPRGWRTSATTSRTKTRSARSDGHRRAGRSASNLSHTQARRYPRRRSFLEMAGG